MHSLKNLFFHESLRKWHFEVLKNKSGLSRERVNHYLKQLMKEGFITRIKEEGRMPYYAANINPTFRIAKRLYGLQLLHNSGLLTQLSSSKSIKTAILFGSFSRGDWSKSSDIDLFVYGNIAFDKGKYERLLGREIQLFNYQKPEQIKELDPQLIPNILKGIHLTENIDPFVVDIRD